MIRAFSFPVSPERGRLRGWLEGSLAGLCELHLLRERQARRVRQALRLGTEPAELAAGETEPGSAGEPDPEEQLDALPGLMWELEQQVGGLRLYPEKACGEAAETDSWPSSGFYEGASSAVASDSPASGFGDSSGFPSASGSCSRIGQAECRGSYASERPKSMGEVGSSAKDGATRGMVPRSYSAPYASAQDYPAEPPPRPPPRDSLDPFLYPSPLHAVAMQNPLLRGHLYDAVPFSPGLAFGAEQAGGLEEFGEQELPGYPEASHCHKVESYISRLIRRRSQLSRGGKPRTSLNAEPPAKGVARQNSLCTRPSELLPPPVERRPPPAMERGSSTPSPCGYEGGAGVAARIWSSWDAAAERTLAAKGPPEGYGAPPSSLKKPPKLQALAHLRPALSMEHYEEGLGEEGAPPRNGQEPAYEERGGRALAACAEDGACQMVKAQYIPAQQPPRAQQAHRGARKKPPPLTKGRSVELSPERAPVTPRERPRAAALPKKCRFTEEGGEAAGGRRGGARKGSPRGKKAARSQSENSLLNKPGASGPKYHTVERDEGPLKPPRPRRPPAGAAGYRKWRSTAEISQEEAGGGEPRRSRRAGRGAASPPRHVLYGYAGSDSECSGGGARRAPVCRLEEGLAYGESESSLSEGGSPTLSTGSSDTDESSGLVWPQQLSPQLVASAGPGQAAGRPKVFVKIKASHALKKKIMRFRSGSLKVMTTV
ncbi:LOW QUALITY PROTEIN: dapper homolog 3 [Pelodiscus sinensis]|uniref:LOW QUALITY PROTEIN: dapper homolog 3 n=1 Tax=Pelodiscus sinensis TaxID=13735 RepID=UPI003F6A9F9A